MEAPKRSPTPRGDPFERQFRRVSRACRGIRKRRRLTLEDVEKKTLIPWKTVKAIEDGRYFPPLSLLRALAECYEISLRTFLGFNSKPFRDFCVMYFDGPATDSSQRDDLFDLFTRIQDFLSDEEEKET